MRRVLWCFNEWLRRIAPARGNGRAACHGLESLPQYMQMDGAAVVSGDALWPARVVVRWYSDGVQSKKLRVGITTSSKAEPAVHPSRASLLRATGNGSFRR